MASVITGEVGLAVELEKGAVAIVGTAAVLESRVNPAVQSRSDMVSEWGWQGQRQAIRGSAGGWGNGY